ncbi:MAG TPA: family 16 glycosylhydrolase [Prolixibacteraceae bacterium]|nr:family 16 glycosylhydrolase [Prolixibacteraceae bacterium]
MKLFSTLCLFLCLYLHAHSQKYVMVWNDEFNTPGLPDSTRWDYEIGKLRNDELQYYTYKRKENARIQDTVLIIEARKEAFMGAAYTSASLRSKLKGDWQYGKFEISAKVPAGKGTWPAIWMLPTDEEYGGWPKSGEIDIMEYVGMNPNNLYYTVHYFGTNGTGHQSSGTYTTYSMPYTKFIKFTLVWTPTKMEWFQDDVRKFTYTKSATADYRTWPFDKMFYMILNLAYGGSWGAQQGIDDTKLPHKFYVDYVRVYQMQESTGPFSVNLQAPTGGTVDISPKMDTYPEGTEVTLTATPDAKYEFDKWLHIGASNPMKMIVSKDISLVPLFKKKNELLINGDFTLGAKNWGNLYINNSATMAASVSVTDGIYAINITKPGTANWHIVDQQLNIPVEKAVTYNVTFDAWADIPGSMDIFIAKNYGDYGSYFSTVKSITTTRQSFTWSFKTTVADPNCRYGFGFGKFTGKVYMDNVSVEKQVPTATEGFNTLIDNSFEVFPNPAYNFLYISNKSSKALQPAIHLYNLQGQLITSLWENKSLAAGQQIRLTLEELKAGNGVYLVVISTPEKTITRKLIINRH